jgi:hypothetical protein
VEANARWPACVVESIEQDEQDAAGADDSAADKHQFLAILILLSGNCRLFSRDRPSASRRLCLFGGAKQSHEAKNHQ